MAPTDALAGIALGLSLVLLQLNRAVVAGQLLGLFVSFIGILGITGYAFLLRTLYAVGSYTPASAQSVVFSAMLGFGVMCVRPDRGLMRVLASPTVGGTAARRLLPLGIGFPVLVASISVFGNWLGLGRSPFGGIIILTICIVAFTAPILWTAVLLYRTDSKRQRVERELALQYEVGRILIESAQVSHAAGPILKSIGTNLGWDWCTVWGVRAPGSLRAIASWQSSNLDVRAMRTIIAHRALDEKSSIWRERLETSSQEAAAWSRQAGLV
jgi:hypothetical protein